MASYAPRQRIPSASPSPGYATPSQGRSYPRRRDSSPEVDTSFAKRASIKRGRVTLSEPHKRRRLDSTISFSEDTVVTMLERINQTVVDNGRAGRAFETRFDHHVVDVRAQFDEMREVIGELYGEVQKLRQLVKGKGRESIAHVDAHAYDLSNVPHNTGTNLQTPLSQAASPSGREGSGYPSSTGCATGDATFQSGVASAQKSPLASAGQGLNYSHPIQELKDRYERSLYVRSQSPEHQRTVPFTYQRRPGTNRVQVDTEVVERRRTELEDIVDLRAWGHEEALSRPNISTRASFPGAAQAEESNEESDSSSAVVDDDGPDDSTPKWPALPLIHHKSSMMCRTCKRRSHRSCAGLPTSEKVTTDWKCPTCASPSSLSQPQEDPPASFSVCLHPDCDKPIQVPPPHKAGVKADYSDEDCSGTPNSLLGRRVYFSQGVRKEFVLISWIDWEIYDSTWELPQGIPTNWLHRETRDLEAEAAKEGRDLTKNHVFIRRKARKWFSPDGKYLTKDIFKETGKCRSWWWKQWSAKTRPLWWGSDPGLENTYPEPDNSGGRASEADQVLEGQVGYARDGTSVFSEERS